MVLGENAILLLNSMSKGEVSSDGGLELATQVRKGLSAEETSAVYTPRQPPPQVYTPRSLKREFDGS